MRNKSQYNFTKSFTALLIVSTAFAQSTSLAAPQTTGKVKGKPVQLLFVQSAASGTFMANPKKVGTYILTFNKTEAMTSYFSDRPGRITGLMSSQKLAEQFVKKSSFWRDPPNAALIVTNAKGQRETLIVELLSSTYTSGKQVYEVQFLKQDGRIANEDIPATFSKADLFIDDLWGWVSDTASTVGNAVGSAASTVGGAVSSAASTVGDAVGSAASTVGGAVSSAASDVEEVAADHPIIAGAVVVGAIATCGVLTGGACVGVAAEVAADDAATTVVTDVAEDVGANVVEDSDEESFVGRKFSDSFDDSAPMDPVTEDSPRTQQWMRDYNAKFYPQ